MKYPGTKHEIILLFLAFGWSFGILGCNWLDQGTGKLSLMRPLNIPPPVTISKIMAGALAVGEVIAEELSSSLISAGLAPDEAQIIVDSTRTEMTAAAGTISVQTLALVETNPLGVVAGPAVRGAIRSLDEPGVNLGDSTRRVAIAQVVMSSTVGSLGGRTTGLTTEDVLSLQKDMVGKGVKSLNDAGLGGDSAAVAIKALTTGAAASLAKSVDTSSAAAAAANIVSGAIESLASAGISTEKIQNIVGSAVEGVVTQLSKTGVQDPGEAASLVAKSSVQSLKILSLPVEKIIEATEGAAKGAVSALATAGVPKEAIAAAAQKVASSSASALKTAGVPDDSVGKAAGAIASGAIQGLGAAGLTVSEIASSGSISAIVSGASSGVAESGVAKDKITNALGEVAGTAITAISKMSSTTGGDVSAIQSQIVSEVIQTTITQAIRAGVASSTNIEAVTKTIATGAGEGLATLSKAGVTVSNIDAVIKSATVEALTKEQSKIGLDASTISSVATSAGQTADTVKTVQVAKASGTTLSKCARTYPDTMNDPDFIQLIKSLSAMPVCEKEESANCPKKRVAPEATATWIAVSNTCQLKVLKVLEAPLPSAIVNCPSQIRESLPSASLSKLSDPDRDVFVCIVPSGSCPTPGFDAVMLSPQAAGAQKCYYTRNPALNDQVVFSLTSGTYSEAQTLWISAPRGATVYLTDDGSTPSASHGALYGKGPLVIGLASTLKAASVTNGSTVQNSISISISAASPLPLCSERYPDTLDNANFENRLRDDFIATLTAPSCVRRTLELQCPKSRTFDAGTSSAKTVQWTSIANSNQCQFQGLSSTASNLAPVTLSLTQGTYTAGQTVSLSGPEGATLYYIINETAPQPYNVPLVLDTTTTLRAFVYKSGAVSPTTTAIYGIMPSCSSLVQAGLITTSTWTTLSVNTSKSSQRYCSASQTESCPALSNDLQTSDVRGPKPTTLGPSVICSYEEPNRCDAIFSGQSALTSSALMQSGMTNDFGDVSCTRATAAGSTCVPLDPVNNDYTMSTGLALPVSRTYCHYIRATTPCPTTMLPSQTSGSARLLSNVITASDQAAMDQLPNSSIFATSCKLNGGVQYPRVEPSMANAGYFAEIQQSPGISRIALRYRAPPCPKLGSASALTLDDLKNMPFIENRGIKACEAPTESQCPSAPSPYGRQFPSPTYTFHDHASARCTYFFAAPVDCHSYEQLAEGNLSKFDDASNSLYLCRKTIGNCPDGGTYLGLISPSIEGEQHCLYQTNANSCYDLKTRNPGLTSGKYMIDPDGVGSDPAFEAYCDMSTDGGGWTLVGRGRQGWAWNDNGKNPDQVTIGVGTSAAFTPSYLGASSIDKILGANAGFGLKDLRDGIRIKRAADTTGTTYQENRWKFADRLNWTWLFPNATALQSISVNSTVYGSSNTQDTWGQVGDNGWPRIFTWAWDGHNHIDGFSYGQSVAGGNQTSTNFFWQYGGETHAIPYTEVYVRH